MDNIDRTENVVHTFLLQAIMRSLKKHNVDIFNDAKDMFFESIENLKEQYRNTKDTESPEVITEYLNDLDFVMQYFRFLNK